MSESKCLLSKESIEVLKKCEGKTIINVGSKDEHKKGCALWTLSIAFDDDAVFEASICPRIIKLLGRDESVSGLDCKIVTKKDKYMQAIEPFMIKSIEVCTDEIYSMDLELGNDIVALDSGVTFHGDNGKKISFTIGKEYYDDDWIDFGVNKAIGEMRSVAAVAEAWGDGVDGHKVTVERSKRRL